MVDLLQKLQSQMYIETLKDKMTTVNKNFIDSMKNLAKTVEDKSHKGPIMINMKSSDENKENIGNSFFEKIELGTTTSMVPVNMNYFVFPGAIEEEKISCLEKAFQKNMRDSVNQNHLFIMESLGLNNLASLKENV